MPFTRLVLVVLSAGVASLGGARLSAQNGPQPLQSEIRVDGFFARSSAVEAGFGLSIPSGIYVRNGIVVGLGAGRHGADGRTDFVTRFSFDPFRQSRWALYGGGGISGRYRPSTDGGSHAYLLVFLGMEGPLPLGQSAGWVPAVEVGLGGGARVGFVLRRGITGRR